MGGGVESDYSVCPRPFLQFCQFMLVRLRQVTSGYVRLCQVTSDYVSLHWRDRTWSSTKTVAQFRDFDQISHIVSLCWAGVGCQQVISMSRVMSSLQ